MQVSKRTFLLLCLTNISLRLANVLLGWGIAVCASGFTGRCQNWRCVFGAAFACACRPHSNRTWQSNQGAQRVFMYSLALPSGDDATTTASGPPPPTAIDDDEHTRLVVDVITDSSASPSGDDASPTTSAAVDDDIKPVDLTLMRDQDAADDVRIMREAYGRQWVVDHPAKADSPTTESVVVCNEPAPPTWAWSTTDSTSSTSDSSDLQTEILC